MKKNSVFFITIFTIIGFGGFLYSKYQNKSLPVVDNPTTKKTSSPGPSSLDQKPVDYKASFAIFTNGTFRIFSDSRYHMKSDDIYLEALNPNIVNLKKNGLTWNDLFLTLPMKLTPDCLTTGTNQIFCNGSEGKLEFYINGVKNQSALFSEIKPGDKLLVTYGNISDDVLFSQLQKIPNP